MQETIMKSHAMQNHRSSSKYGGMEATDVNRLKELEEENAKLKKMLSDVSLENNAIKKIVAKKGGH